MRLCGLHGAAGPSAVRRALVGAAPRRPQLYWAATPVAKEVSQTGRAKDWARVGP